MDFGGGGPSGGCLATKIKNKRNLFGGLKREQMKKRTNEDKY